MSADTRAEEYAQTFVLAALLGTSGRTTRRVMGASNSRLLDIRGFLRKLGIALIWRAATPTLRAVYPESCGFLEY
jgi:hypothetical protein